MPITIDSSNIDAFKEAIKEHGYSTGLAYRDYGIYHSGYDAATPTFPDALLLDESLWESYLRVQQEAKASLYDLREMYYPILKSLDQDGLGLCWSFSSAKQEMNCLVKQGQTPRILSPWYVAGKVKGWRDQGGWCQQSAAFLAKYGAPDMELCPGYNKRFDTPEVAANAALHQLTKWFDGSHDRDTNRKIMVSALLQGMCPVGDFNHLGHSMAICRLVSLNPLTIDCDNSWNSIDRFGEKGLYRLSGQYAIPDNICVCVAAESLA